MKTVFALALFALTVFSVQAMPGGIERLLKDDQVRKVESCMNGVAVEQVLGIYRSHERKTQGNNIIFVFDCEYVSPYCCGTKRTNADGSVDVFIGNLGTLVEHIPAVVQDGGTEEEHYYDESGLEMARYTMTLIPD